MRFYRFNTLLIGILGAFILVGCGNSNSKGQASSSSSASARQNSKQPRVVLTEYADFQCPTCGYFYPIVKKLKKTYGDTLKVRYRYFPLNSHSHSRLAARAAQAARNQGKFQAMHDMLFKNQDKWDDSGNPQQIFIDYAKRIGLNIKKFKKDLNAAKTQKIVMQQKKEGEKRGVNSTPTFFINGEEVTSLPRNFKQFKALLDIYVKEARHKAKHG
ncbi:MAG TPA: thioredoxin domain-containing protein [Balneolaceae bacterium]|nr:thioredoxin domain-containing protein [Balneolaceae bacterium]